MLYGKVYNVSAIKVLLTMGSLEESFKRRKKKIERNSSFMVREKKHFLRISETILE